MVMCYLSNSPVYDVIKRIQKKKKNKKVSPKGSKRRLKSWVKLQSKRRKTKLRVKDIGANSESITCSTPPISLQTMTNQFNFTELLTAPLDPTLCSFGAMDLIEESSNVNNQIVDTLQLL